MNRYRKGADYERKLVKEAKEDGLIAFRSAGSHSPIDVILIDVENKIIDLLQCKAGKSYTESFKQRLRDQYISLSGQFLVRFDVV